jgi:hypothetical protein
MAGWKFYLNNIEVAEPIGWDAIEFTAKRLENHGVDQPFTTEISFIGKAANILKGFFDSGFINDDIPFRIESSVKVQGQDYEFNGFINMAVYSEKNTCDTNGYEITVGLIEDPFRENFLTRQDVEIDLLSLKNLDQATIDPLTFQTVRLHTQELFLVGRGSNYSTQTSTIFYDSGTGWNLDDFATMMPVYWRNSDFKGVFGNTLDAQGSSYSTFRPCFVNNSEFTRTLNFNIRANGNFEWFGSQPGATANISFSIQVLNSSGTETQRYYPYATPALLTTTPEVPLDWDFDIPIQLTLSPGDKVLMFMQWGDVGNVKVGITPTPDVFYRLAVRVIDICVTVNELNSASFASLADGLYVFNFLQRVIEIITGYSDGLVSDFFAVGTGPQWNNLLTIGLYIRNAPSPTETINGCSNVEEANSFAMKTSFKKLFDDLSRIFNLGWGFEYNTTISQWQIRVEPMDFFYNNFLNIGEFNKASGIVQYALSEKMVNNFQLGFTDLWKNIAVSGTFEPHTYRSYFTPNKSRSSEKKTEDLRSNIICSGYAIEFSRRLQFLRDDSGSSDRPNDYSLFLIWLNLPEVYFPYIAGSGYELPDETGSATFAPGTISVGSDLVGTTDAPITRIYNILHTPARIAARYWKLLGMHTFGLPDAKAALFFQSGEYYTDLVSEIDDEYFPVADQEISGSVAENTNISEAILEGGLNDYLFKPIGFDFDFPQSLCSFITMGNLAYGYIKVTSGGQTFYGYLLDGVNKPTDPNSGKTTFKLILSKTIPLGPGAFSSGFSEGFS